MIVIKRTNSGDKNFQSLVSLLDADLKIRDGDQHVFYGQLNKTDTLKYVVVAYSDDEAIGCGAIREHSPEIMEVKRMFVMPGNRRQGIASIILAELEKWAGEMNFKKCILETGQNQPEAIRLYEMNHYSRIPNFGHYVNVASSVCFEKELTYEI